jgi:hypothetical protein
MTYDNWKTTNPADEFLGPEPEEEEEMDMVERVARAVDAEWASHIINGTLASPKDFARAAIAAMREPTEEMVRAQWSETTCGVEGWRAMIDAALNEKST